MTTNELLSILQLVTAISLSLGLVCLAFSLFYFRRSRRDAYWRYRRDAGQRGFQFIVASVLLLVLGSAFCMVTFTITFVERDAEGEAAVDNASATPTPSPTITTSPTLPLPTLSSENVLPSATPFPFETAEPLPESTASTPSEVAVSASATATPTETLAVPTATPTPEIRTVMQIQAIDSEISASWQPVQPATRFASATRRLYFYLSFANVEPGAAWKKSLYHDGQVIKEQVDPWGVLPAQGSTFFFFGDAAGFAPGNYEIRMSIADIVVATSQFIVE